MRPATARPAVSPGRNLARDDRRRHGTSECIDHGQKPRSREKKMLFDGGYGVTSCPRPMFCVPKLLISGSRPVYGKLLHRFRPETCSLALESRTHDTD